MRRDIFNGPTITKAWELAIRLISVVAVLILAAASFPWLGRAQVSTSSILGRVSDPTGAVIPQASVVLTNRQTGAKQTTTTDEAGDYIFSNLQPGFYDISVEQTGFKRSVLSNIQLLIDQRLRQDFALELGQVTQQLTVTAAGTTQLLETDTAVLGQVIEERRVLDLPLNGRNYLQLAALSAGATVPSNVFGGSLINQTTFRENRSIHVGGNRESATSYLIDGIEARNSRIGESSINLTIDSIREFKVQRNFFLPEVGIFPSAINVATRSGGNTFHASAWEFIRNDNLDARNFFSKDVEPFHRNQFGVVAGGPIIKDKTFFFGGYEGLRQRLGQIQTGFFPTQKELSGDLSDLLNPPPGSGLAPIQIYDPQSFDPATGKRLPFANDIIPSNRINQVAKAVIPFFPVTTNPFASPNATGTPTQRQDDYQFSIRIDQQISSKHSSFGRMTWINSDLFAPSIAPTRGQLVPQRGVNAVFQLNSSLTPNLINIFRVGYNRGYLFQFQETVNGTNLNQQVGLTGTSDAPFDRGLAQFALGGFDTIGSFPINQGNILNLYQLGDDVTLMKGKHVLKGGIDIRYHRLYNLENFTARGIINFSPIFSAQLARDAAGNLAPMGGTGSSLADFLLGMPANSSTATGSTLLHLNSTSYSLFLQDEWKVAPRLTLQAGILYYFPQQSKPISQERDRTHFFNFQTGKLIYSGLNEVRPEVLDPDFNDFAPRIGLAYHAFKDTVIRAGFGVYYDQTQQNEHQFLAIAPPIFSILGIQNLPGKPTPDFVLGQNVFPIVPLPPLSPTFADTIPSGFSPFLFNKRARTPYVEQWNLSIQQRIGRNLVIEAAYLGSQGHKLSDRRDINQCSRPGSIICDSSIKPYPRYNFVLLSESAASSNYHGLNLRVERQFANGFSFLSSYTYSKSIDSDSAGSFGTSNQIANDRRFDRGLSTFDQRHRFVLSYLWELPVGKRKSFLNNLSPIPNFILSGWEIDGITAFQSGVPGSVTAPNLTGAPFLQARADRLSSRDPLLHQDPRSNGLKWFDTSLFAQPVPLRFGTAGRNILMNPGINNWDFGILKRTYLREETNIEFRTEFFNLFNHAQFDGLGMGFGSATFGKITSARRPRVIQFGLKFNW